MAINDVLGLTVDVSATTDNFVKALQKAAAGAKLSLDVKDPLIASFKAAQSKVKGMFAQTVADGATAGLGKAQLGGFIKKLQPLTDGIEDSMKRIFKMEVATRKAGLSEAKKDQLRTLLDTERVKLKGLETRLKVERRGAEGIIERRKAVMQEAEKLAARTMAEAGEEFGQSISTAFENLKSGNIGDIFKGMGKGAGARGEMLKEKGVASGGMKGEMMQGLGGILKTLGPILLMVGALVAGIAAVGKMILDADAKAKELNRTLLDSGVAMGELTDSFGEGSENLGKLVRTFSNADGAFAFNRLWGTTAKDHLEIIGAYSKAGLTFKELQTSAAAAGTEMERLQAATAATLTYAKLLGTSNTEMAEIFATRMEEMGQNIDGVSKSLSAVHMAAQESGFGVKRFFNMVLQATTGMTMYNVRMEEAAGLLTRLGKILGAKMGGDFLQGLTKGFGDESTQDKHKRVMTTGTGRTKAVFGRSAEKTAADFLGKVNDQKMGPAFRKALEGSGLKLDMSSTKTLVRDIQRMTMGEQGKLLASARSTGNDELVQQLESLTGVAQGAKGGTGNMAMNLGSLDMGGKLMMQLQQGMAVIGKPLHEMGEVETMAFENMTGVQGEQLMQLRAVSKAMYGNYDMLKGMAKAGKEGSPAEKVNQAKQFGAIVENGKVVAARWDEASKTLVTGEKMDSIGDYIQGQGDLFQKTAADTISSDTKLAQAQVAATTEMSKILEQGVEMLLMEINDAVQGISAWLTSGLDATERQAKKELVEELQAGFRGLREEERAASKKYSEAQSIAKTAKGADKAKAEADMAAAVDEQKKIRSRMTEQKARVEKAKSLSEGYGMTGSFSKKDLKEKVMGSITAADRLKVTEDPEERAAKQKEMVAAAAAAKKAVLDKALAQFGAKDMADLESKIAATKKDMPAQHHGPGGGFDGLSKEEQAAGAIQNLQARMEKAAKEASEAVMKPAEWTDIFDLNKMADEHTKKEKALLTQKGANSVAGVQADAIGKKMEDVNLSTDAKNRQALKEDEIQAKLAGILGAAGVTDATPTQMSTWATDLAAGKGAPEGLKELFDRGTGDKNVKTAFDASGLGLSGPAAKDFIMQIGAGGQVKFAQRIDGGDTVTAAKPGGAIDTAGRGAGGGGGVTIIQHNYSGTEAIQKGYRALAAAKAL